MNHPSKQTAEESLVNQQDLFIQLLLHMVYYAYAEQVQLHISRSVKNVHKTSVKRWVSTKQSVRLKP